MPNINKYILTNNKYRRYPERMTASPPKRTPTLFLQAVLVLIALGTLAFLLYEPHVEGRNVDATLFQIYFQDPFLAYVYLSSIPFFIALYQACALLRHISANRVFSRQSVRALRTIKMCGLLLIAAIAGAELFFFTVQSKTEDIAGGVAMGLFALFVAMIITTAAAVFEKLLHAAVEMKEENDQTV